MIRNKWEMNSKETKAVFKELMEAFEIVIKIIILRKVEFAAFRDKIQSFLIFICLTGKKRLKSAGLKAFFVK